VSPAAAFCTAVVRAQGAAAEQTVPVPAGEA